MIYPFRKRCSDGRGQKIVEYLMARREALRVLDNSLDSRLRGNDKSGQVPVIPGQVPVISAKAGIQGLGTRGHIPGLSEKLLFFLFFILFLIASCGEMNDYAADIPPGSPDQLILTPIKHTEGWGLSECLLCHQTFRIHLRSTDPNIDLEEIRRIVYLEGEASCMFCHGSNGT